MCSTYRPRFDGRLNSRWALSWPTDQIIILIPVMSILCTLNSCPHLVFPWHSYPNVLSSFSTFLQHIRIPESPHDSPVVPTGPNTQSPSPSITALPRTLLSLRPTPTVSLPNPALPSPASHVCYLLFFLACSGSMLWLFQGCACVHDLASNWPRAAPRTTWAAGVLLCLVLVLNKIRFQGQNVLS